MFPYSTTGQLRYMRRLAYPNHNLGSLYAGQNKSQQCIISCAKYNKLTNPFNTIRINLLTALIPGYSLLDAISHTSHFFLRTLSSGKPQKKITAHNINWTIQYFFCSQTTFIPHIYLYTLIDVNLPLVGFTSYYVQENEQQRIARM